MKVEIDQDLFWKIYTILRDTEGVLWECDGAVNPEDENLVDSITELTDQLADTLDSLQPIVSQLKSD